jgi:hypothetical protein
MKNGFADVVLVKSTKSTRSSNPSNFWGRPLYSIGTCILRFFFLPGFDGFDGFDGFKERGR